MTTPIDTKAMRAQALSDIDHDVDRRMTPQKLLALLDRLEAAEVLMRFSVPMHIEGCAAMIRESDHPCTCGKDQAVQIWQRLAREEG